jgi:pyruvate formate lyase activating enzyme
LEKIRKILGKDTAWVLQQFRQPPQGVLAGRQYEAYTDFWLKEIGDKLKCQVRGVS